MRRSKRRWLVFAAAILGGGQAWAQVASDQPGDPVSGRKLAEAWCAECHAVGPKTIDAPRRGPDFAAVAQRVSTTPLSLNVFLRSNHDSMPNFIVSGTDADDIVAYIMSLKSR